jgi:hypothetical protein
MFSKVSGEIIEIHNFISCARFLNKHTHNGAHLVAILSKMKELNKKPQPCALLDCCVSSILLNCTLLLFRNAKGRKKRGKMGFALARFRPL